MGATWSTLVTIPLSAVSVTLTAMKATLSTRGTSTGTNVVDWDDVKIY